jgi:hypothetical protein
MSDVFLSYAHQDRPAARTFAEWLSARGLSVFWDRKIGPGARWDVTLEAELKQARCVVVLWTRHAVESQWVRTEAGEAADRSVLVPVLLEAAELPLRFKSLQTADLTGWDGDETDPEAQQVLASVQRLAARAPSLPRLEPEPSRIPTARESNPATRSRFPWVGGEGRRARRLFWGQIGALGLGGVLGLFLPHPVGMEVGGEKSWLRFALLAMVVLPGIGLLAVPRWIEPRHALRWWGLAAGAVIAASVSFFQYQRLLYSWTGEYDGRLLVVGDEYTEQGASYVQSHPQLPLSTLLEDFIGRPEDIWTRRSINRRKQALAAWHASCLPLFTLSALAWLQAMRCREAPVGTRRAPTPAAVP